MKATQTEIHWTNQKGKKITFQVKQQIEAIKLKTNMIKSALSRQDLENFLTFAEEYCISQNTTILIIQDYLVDFSDTTYVKEKGYRALWDLLEDLEHQKIYRDDFLYGTWAKEINQGKIKENKNMYTLLKEELEELKKHNPTLEYSMTYEHLLLSYRGIERQKINMRLKGTFADIWLEGKKEMYTVKNKEETHVTFQKILQLIEKKTKVKQLFEPSKKYFRFFMDKHLTKNLEAQDVIYMTLRKFYSPNEIEDYCAIKKEAKRIKKVKHAFSSQGDELIMLLFDNQVLLVENTKAKKSAHLFQTKEEAKAAFHQQGEENYERQIKSFKKETQSKLNKF
jgi:hypothetical protein